MYTGVKYGNMWLRSHAKIEAMRELKCLSEISFETKTYVSTLVVLSIGLEK